jgi:hypothetical protein
MRIALMAVLVAFSAPALAGTADTKAPSVDAQAAQTTPQAPKAEDQAERKICKRIDASESRVAAKRACLTEEQWKQRAQESSDL